MQKLIRILAGVLTLMIVLSQLAFSQLRFVSNLVEGSNPSISELEDQYGELELTDEFQVKLETAQLERALQEEDSLGFASSFSGEGAVLSGGNPPSLIAEFIGYFTRVMRRRSIQAPDGETYTATFDFAIRDTRTRRCGNHIDLNATVEFAYLMVDDSTRTPISYPIEARFFPRRHRWKIRHVQGLFEFFYACIERLSPTEMIPGKFLALTGKSTKLPRDKMGGEVQ